MKKLRVIWIDDERDPNPRILSNSGNWTEWWYRNIPEEFRELVNSLPVGEKVEVVWLKSYDEWLKWCIEVWHEEHDDDIINCFCLDHDLASYNKEGREKTGVDVAYDITEECTISGRPIPYYECHSSNPAGKENIISVFESYRKVFGQ